MDSRYDIIIFAGQSNMQGETEGLPEINDVIENAMEYRLSGNGFIELKHPVGEEVGYGVLSGACKGCGTLVPDFCKEYTNKTGKKVVAVHTAKGATTIRTWLKGTERYECVKNKVLGAINKTKEIGEIGKIYFVWLQGESDAIIGTAKDEYKQMLIDLKNSLTEDLGIDEFCLIQIGYFCSIAPWLEFSKNGQGKPRDEAIMNAQKELSQNDGFIMLTEMCKEICLNPEYMNPFVGGHYNNKGMTLIGKTAGAKLAEISTNEYGND